MISSYVAQRLSINQHHQIFFHLIIENQRSSSRKFRTNALFGDSVNSFSIFAKYPGHFCMFDPLTFTMTKVSHGEENLFSGALRIDTFQGSRKRFEEFSDDR
jgi:hypothetical protein